jgi:CBS domain-containing protein
MTIAAILQRKGNEVASIAVNATVREAVTILAERRIGAVPVTDGDRVAGILSERDVIYCLRSMPALVALSEMTKRRIRHLPIVEGGRLTGIVSIGDLVAYRIRRIEDEAEAMRTYIQSA